MSQLKGKQLLDQSLGLVKWDLTGSQGTVTLGTGSMIGVNDAPTNATDLANKEYVDGVAAGLDPKESVVVKSTANITISGLLTIDGHTLLAGERVLLVDQTNTVENGIYTASVGTWSRAPDSDGTPLNEVTLGNFTFVGTGSSWASTGWVLGSSNATNGNVSIVPGTDTQVWVQFSASAALSGGSGVNILGQSIDVDLSAISGLTFSTTGASGTLEVRAGDGVKIDNTNSVSVDLLLNGGLSISGTQLQVDPTIAGAGSTITSGVLDIGQGNGVIVNANSIQINGTALAGTNITWDGTSFNSLAGDITGVTAGAGLTGGGNSGGVTLDIGAGNGISVSADAVSVIAGTGITVDGTGVSVDGASLAGTNITWDGTSFNSLAGDITGVTAGAGLTGGGNTGGVTLDIGAGNGISVSADAVSVIAGTGITVDGTGVNSNAGGNLIANLTALGLTSGINTIQEALSSLLSKSNVITSEQTLAYSTSAGNNSNTTYALVGAPAAGNEVNLHVNGQLQRYGTAYDYYFSTDGTLVNAVTQTSVSNGNILVWNGIQAGFEIVNGTDLVDITYNKVLV